MTDRVLNRYELQTRQVHLEPLYPGAEVWLGRDTQAGRPATIVTYPWAQEQTGSATARALWSAELRKLFRLSCLPFDPSLVGFVNGGFDEPTRKLVLLTQDADLPSVQTWFADGRGMSCATAVARRPRPQSRRAAGTTSLGSSVLSLQSMRAGSFTAVSSPTMSWSMRRCRATSQGFSSSAGLRPVPSSETLPLRAPVAGGAIQVVGHNPWYAVDLGAAASPWPHTRWHSIRRRVRAVCHRSLAAQRAPQGECGSLPLPRCPHQWRHH